MITKEEYAELQKLAGLLLSVGGIAAGYCGALHPVTLRSVRAISEVQLLLRELAEQELID